MIRPPSKVMPWSKPPFWGRAAVARRHEHRVGSRGDRVVGVRHVQELILGGDRHDIAARATVALGRRDRQTAMAALHLNCRRGGPVVGGSR